MENAGHLPLFGILALTLLGSLPQWLERRFPAGGPRYALVLALSLIIALLSESIQTLVAREFSLLDIGRDMAGAAAFLCAHSAFTGMAPGWNRRLCIAAAVLLVGAGVMSPLIWAAGYAARNLQFPVILDGGSVLSRLFVDCDSAELSGVIAPAVWPDPQPSSVGRLVMNPAPYSGMVLTDPIADWSAYDHLQMELFVPDPTPLEITIRIDDQEPRGQFWDRYNEAFRLAPGMNRIRIPLERIRSAARGRTLDLTAIVNVYLFGVKLETPRSLLIGRFTLEAEHASGPGAAATVP